MSYLRKMIKWLPALVVFASPLYLLRFELGGFSTNVLEIMIVGFVLIWLIYGSLFGKVSGTLKSKVPDTLFFPIALVLAGALSSSLASLDPKTSFGILKSWFVLPALFGWAAAGLIKSREDIKRILYSLAGSGLAVSLISLGYLFSHKLTFDGRLSAFYLSPNHLAMYLAPAFLVSLVLGIFANGNKEKIFFYAASVIMGIALYFTFSYAAWLGVLGGVAFVIATRGSYSSFSKGGAPQLRGGGFKSLPPSEDSLYERENKSITERIFACIAGFFYSSIVLSEGKLGHLRRLACPAGRLGFLAMTIFVGVLLLLGNAQKFQNLLAFDRSSLESRLMIWRSAGMILKDHWLLGIGPGNFQAQYLDYQKYFPPYLEWAVPQPHNLFLAFWLQTGLFGLIGFVWLCILLLKILWQNKKEPVALALLAVLIYILIHGLSDTPLWKNDLALLFAAIIISTHKASRFCGW